MRVRERSRTEGGEQGEGRVPTPSAPLEERPSPISCSGTALFVGGREPLQLRHQRPAPRCLVRVSLRARVRLGLGQVRAGVRVRVRGRLRAGARARLEFGRSPA